MCNGVRRAILALVVAALAVATPAAGAADPPAFSDWTAATIGSSASGTFEGRPITLSGPITAGSVTDHSFPYFNSAYFTPPLEFSDVVSFAASNTHSFTLTLGVPVRDPIIDVGSLASTITFAGAPAITKLSGQDTLTVSGSSVSGQGTVHQPDGTTDSNGTIQLHGDFESLSFTIPNTAGGGTPDGIYFQFGGTLPPGAGNTARPIMTGKPAPQQTLSCTTGSWDRSSLTPTSGSARRA
jgi:hypothetical protein